MGEDGYTVDGSSWRSQNPIRSQPIVRQAMLWGFQVEEMTDAFTDRAFGEGYNVIYDTMGNEPNRFLHELIKRARRNNHDYKVIVLGCYAPKDACKKRYTERARTQGRYVDDAFATRNYDIIFPNGVCDEVHYDKFKRELRVGDERYLYDNSVDDKNPKLVTNDTIDSNSKPVVEKLDTSKLKSDGTDGDEAQKTKSA